MDAILSLWLHESPEHRVGAAAAKVAVVQDAAARAVAVHDTVAKAVAVHDFAIKGYRSKYCCGCMHGRQRLLRTCKVYVHLDAES